MLLVCVTTAETASAATLHPKTIRGWETYVQATETRIDSEINRGTSFLSLDSKPPEDRARIQKVLQGGSVYVEQMQTKDAHGKEIKVDDGMIHHWYGSIFIPNMKLETLIQRVQDYDHHSDYFPEVEKSRLVSRDGDSFKIFLRLVRKKVVTVHYNTEHSVLYRTHTGTRVSSRSAASRIAEISGAGSSTEKEKTSADDSGFLWRLNSYWRYEETNGGVIVECESISLSRSIPYGFGWIVGPFVESVPHESLNSMLISIRDGVARIKEKDSGPMLSTQK
jgi:hypothetical protein